MQVRSPKAVERQQNPREGNSKRVAGTVEDRKPALADKGMVEKVEHESPFPGFETKGFHQRSGLDEMDVENAVALVLLDDKVEEGLAKELVDETVAAVAAEVD